MRNIKLTKSQRFTAYCILLTDCSEKALGVCLIWYYLFNEQRWLRDKDNLKYILPELWDKRDFEDNNLTWFYSHENRLRAIKKCIKETVID